jgi:hypothetical protein
MFGAFLAAGQAVAVFTTGMAGHSAKTPPSADISQLETSLMLCTEFAFQRIAFCHFALFIFRCRIN